MTEYTQLTTEQKLSLIDQKIAQHEQTLFETCMEYTEVQALADNPQKGSGEMRERMSARIAELGLSIDELNLRIEALRKMSVDVS
jgi:hypothetical protein